MTAGWASRPVELTAIDLKKGAVGVEKKALCVWIKRQGVLVAGKWLFRPLNAACVRKKAAVFFDLKRSYADSLGWQQRDSQRGIAFFNMATLATNSTVVEKSIWRSLR